MLISLPLATDTDNNNGEPVTLNITAYKLIEGKHANLKISDSNRTISVRMKDLINALTLLDK